MLYLNTVNTKYKHEYISSLAPNEDKRKKTKYG